MIPAPELVGLGLGEPEPDEEPEAPEEAELEPLAEEEGVIKTALEAVGPEGRANPVMLPVKGPATTVALAPTPLRLGTGVPGSVPLVAMAAAWYVANEPVPLAGALMAPTMPAEQCGMGTSWPQ